MNKVFILAGEASGDLVGAWFVKKHLHTVVPGATDLVAVGGSALQDAGAVLYRSYTDFNLVGFFEILKKIPFVLKLMHQIADHILSEQYSHVILVDFGGFNLRLGKLLRKRSPDLKIIYVAPPQFWCWGQWRIKTLKFFVNELVVMFPFEVGFYRKHGLVARYLGNPVFDRVMPAITEKKYQLRLAVFPGSRAQELRRFVPLLEATLKLICSTQQALEVAVFLAPHIDRSLLESLLAVDRSRVFLVEPDDRLLMMQSCAVALTKAGTTTLELGLLAIPTIIFYKTDWLTYAIAERLVAVKIMGLPNLLLGKSVMPEYLQENCTPEKIAAALESLLNSFNEKTQLYAESKAALQKIREIF